MDRHAKKMAAPVVIVILLAAYYVGIGFLVFASPLPAWLKGAAIAGAVGVSALLAYALFDRIKEIRKGEEDDLGEY